MRNSRSIYSELDNFLNMTDFDGISNSTVSLEKKVPFCATLLILT